MAIVFKPFDELFAPEYQLTYISMDGHISVDTHVYSVFHYYTMTERQVIFQVCEKHLPWEYTQEQEQWERTMYMYQFVIKSPPPFPYSQYLLSEEIIMALVLGTNCGFVAVAPVADPGGGGWEFDGRALALKVVSPATATKITEIGIWIDNATEEANLDFAIYTHNIGDDNPEAIVTGKINIAKGTTAGWKKQSCDITISAETTYWIAAQLDNVATSTNANIGDDAGETADYKLGQTELTDPWGVSGGTYGDKIWGVYAVWEAAVVGNAGIMTTNAGYWGPTF